MSKKCGNIGPHFQFSNIMYTIIIYILVFFFCFFLYFIVWNLSCFSHQNVISSRKHKQTTLTESNGYDEGKTNPTANFLQEMAVVFFAFFSIFQQRVSSRTVWSSTPALRRDALAPFHIRHSPLWAPWISYYPTEPWPLKRDQYFSKMRHSKLRP